jgi:hypothetical protein
MSTLWSFVCRLTFVLLCVMLPAAVLIIVCMEGGPWCRKSKGSHERSVDAQEHGFRTRCLRFAARVTSPRRKTRRVPTKGFRVLPYVSSPFPKLCLAQPDRPPRANHCRFLALEPHTATDCDGKEWLARA